MSKLGKKLAAIRLIFCFKILLSDTSDVLSMLPVSVVSIFQFSDGSLLHSLVFVVLLVYIPSE